MGKKTPPPSYRPPAGQWRFALKDPEVKAAFRDFFMKDQGRIVSALKSLSKTYHNLEKQDRTGGEKDFFLSLCQPALDSYDRLHQELADGSDPFIDEYLNAYRMLVEAEAEVRVWLQVKAIFAESRGLSDASFVEVITKARAELKAMETGRRKPKIDALGKILMGILEPHFNSTGEFPSCDYVIKELEKIANDERGSEKVIIQEVDENEKCIWWQRPNGSQAKAVSFKSLRNRLTIIRRKIREQ